MSLERGDSVQKVGRVARSRCNKARNHRAFWDASRVQVRHTLKRKSEEFSQELKSSYEEKNAKFANMEAREQAVNQREIETGNVQYRNVIIYCAVEFYI